MADHVRRRLVVTGVVQGVGFRPHVHRLATYLDLVGCVGNDASSVFIEVQGSPSALDDFGRRLVAEAPPLAMVDAVAASPLPVADDHDFQVVPSVAGGRVVPTAPPDSATCGACLEELRDPDGRRHRHPFITCTDCGPRFTIITGLPYDRPRTTMGGFELCGDCRGEYDDPGDRRFHAQPIACHACGPRLAFGAPDVPLPEVADLAQRRAASDAAFVSAQRALMSGHIVAVKGIGGYHLACLASDEAAVRRLRERKRRPGKPFALLARDLGVAREVAVVSDLEAAVLTSRAAPIVLLDARPGDLVAASVAPGNPMLGVMLASNPLHHLLLSDVPGADLAAPQLLVLTSGNLSEEPLCIDDEEAAQRLVGIADEFLWHDRPIAVPCDDSVVRVLDDGPIMVRRSRGHVPTPVTLASPGDPVLALGAELKATVCLSDGQRAWLSQHIGDMGSLTSLQTFEATLQRMVALHGVEPSVLAVDAHPRYASHRWAREQPGEPEVLEVQHHHAHVASVMTEHGRTAPVIGVAFDGTGRGPDGTIWGGEVLRADFCSARRIAHVSLVLLPGGDAAIRHPRRVALSHLATAGIDWTDDLAPVRATPPEERRVLARQLERQVNTVPTSSMGRLFDAVSSLLDVRHDITFEAQAAIELEFLAQRHLDESGSSASLSLPVVDRVGGPLTLDAASLVRDLVEQLTAGTPPGALALAFHETIARAVTEVAAAQRDLDGLDTVALTGGVFGNALLTRLVRERLDAAGFLVLRHHLVPPNDGGIALGQAAIAVARGR